MDIASSMSKITNVLEKNAVILTAFGSMMSRAAETNPNMTDAFTWLINDLSNLGLNAGEGNYGALGEALLTLTNPSQLMYKLLQSTHLYTTVTKIGIGLWAADHLGLIPSRYSGLGQKIALGGAIAAIMMPGSGPNGNAKNNSKGTNPTPGSEYKSSGGRVIGY